MNVKKASQEGTPFCSISEAARRTGLSTYFFRQGVKEGSIPYIKSGRSIFVNLAKWQEQIMKK